jgi:hypothetical protein
MEETVDSRGLLIKHSDNKDPCESLTVARMIKKRECYGEFSHGNREETQAHPSSNFHYSVQWHFHQPLSIAQQFLQRLEHRVLHL